MNSKVKFEHKSSGYIELMKSQEMQNVLSRYGEQIRNSANSSGHAGDSYESSTSVGQTRANVKIYPGNQHAARSNFKYNTLLKALGSVKG